MVCKTPGPTVNIAHPRISSSPLPCTLFSYCAGSLSASTPSMKACSCMPSWSCSVPRPLTRPRDQASRAACAALVTGGTALRACCISSTCAACPCQQSCQQSRALHCTKCFHLVHPGAMLTIALQQTFAQSCASSSEQGRGSLYAARHTAGCCEAHVSTPQPCVIGSACNPSSEICWPPEQWRADSRYVHTGSASVWPCKHLLGALQDARVQAGQPRAVHAKAQRCAACMWQPSNIL